MRRHIETLRLAVQGTVFLMLLYLPCAALYVNVELAHAAHLLSDAERMIHASVRWLTGWMADDPEALDAVRGSTWSATLFGWRVSDPLAVLAQAAARLDLSWAFAATALVPLAGTLLLGRVFCGWLCPAGFLFSLAERLRAGLGRLGVPVGDATLDRRVKYGVLAAGTAASAALGAALLGALYPPAVLAREAHAVIVTGSAGGGGLFLGAALAFDLLVARRGFCRALCPGGALLSLLGRHRVVRVRRRAASCVDCGRCSAACGFGLDPMRDGFGQECTNCLSCVAACPTASLAPRLRLADAPPQGAGGAARGRPAPAAAILSKEVLTNA